MREESKVNFQINPGKSKKNQAQIPNWIMKNVGKSLLTKTVALINKVQNICRMIPKKRHTEVQTFEVRKVVGKFIE